MITPEDLRLAVKRGLISDEQADGLMMIADTRADTGAEMRADGLPGLPLDAAARPPAAAREEPLLLYRGFNEIFIVVGLVILFGAWMLLLFGWVAESWFSSSASLSALGVTLLVLVACQHYFTKIRRMMAPSILLAGLTGLCLAMLGQAMGSAMGLGLLHATYLSAAVMGFGMFSHWRHFRLPFDMVVIAAAALRGLQAVFAPADMGPLDVFMPVAALPLPVSVGFGMAAFVLAMIFDLSDPERRSPRAAAGFWLHVVAAAAIIGPLAQSLTGQGAEAQMILLGLLALLALVALIIDRRSFLVSGAGYAAWLIFDLTDGSPLTVLGLGAALVLLGTQWDTLRALLLRALPNIPGKHRLPPSGA